MRPFERIILMLLGKSLHEPQPQRANAVQPAATQVGTQAVGDVDKPLSPHRVRDLTFVGTGSSVAYLVNELNHRFSTNSHATPLHGKVSIIGQEDPWLPSVRGQGYINHQREIIDQWGPTVPCYNSGYADRGEFAARNRQQLDRAQASVLVPVPIAVSTRPRGASTGRSSATRCGVACSVWNTVCCTRCSA